MKSSKEVLSSLLKTTQLGQTGIRTVLGNAMEPSLRSALRGQLQELDAIEAEARTIAVQRGWELEELDPAAQFLTNKLTQCLLTGRNSDSRLAEIRIRDNTKGMIRCHRDLNQFREQDARVRILSQRLLDWEKAGIRQLREFL